MDEVVANRYRVGRKLGSGGFGQIHLGVDVSSKERVAIKFESAQARYPSLYIEWKLYCHIQGGCHGIPKARWYGRAGEYNALVIDLLGESLQSLLKKCRGKFSLKTVLMLALQMLHIIEYVHSKSYVHRDLKPSNFMMGKGKNAKQVFMIDFGLAKRYRDDRTREHIPYSERDHLTGTAMFASINAHDGIEITRRDDLESIGYVLMYFLRGSLPWEGLTGARKTCKFRKIRYSKVTTSIDALCDGFPSEFKSYFRHIHRLRFDEAPNYAYLKKLFKDLFARKGFRFDYIYDWNK